MRLPLPPTDRAAVVDWVAGHLGHLSGDEVRASPRFRGGQGAADAALAAFDVTGYARRRNEVWPPDRRGASALSPYIRHGLLPLPVVWAAVGDGPPRDRSKFRDELLWQEYARHLYARLGTALGDPLRYAPPERADDVDDEPWDRLMRCMEVTVGELEGDGWLVNQTRMWLASQWTVRAGAPWREGEQRFYANLLDGSRAANRAGWQWAVGSMTGKAYGFSRWQVEKRAPGLCRTCSLADRCPIEGWPAVDDLDRVEPPPRLRADPDPAATGGPVEPDRTGDPEAVWLTAESLGDADPALAARQELPAVFVFDEPLLDHLRLSGKRLVFLAECLADLAARRPLEVHLGSPAEVLVDRPVATTFAPVPGWRRRAEAIAPVEVHPWPWLRRPHAGPVSSFSAWRKGLGRQHA